MSLFNRFIGLFQAPAQPSQTFREAAGTTVEDDEEGWRRLTGDGSRDLSPLTQQRAREVSAWLWQANLMANRLIELPLAFMLADGVTLEVKDEAAQAILSRFWDDPINAMDLKLPKRVRELAIYGEQCYPAFVNEVSGAVRLGYLDPKHIQEVITDPDNPEQPIGVVTMRDGKGRYRRYKVIVNGDEDVFTQRTQAIRAGFTDGECFYFAVNSLSSGVRGRPDLLAAADWLDGYDDYLFGEMDRTKFLRAFIWDVTVKGLDPDAVKKRAAEIAPPGPNSVRVHNESEEWQAISPQLNSADTAESARLLRNHVLGGRTVPEHWFGGGGDVNRSTGDSMGDPAFKVFSMRQREMKHILEEIGRFVLRQAAATTRNFTFDPASPDLKVTAKFPEMITRDASRFAAALQQVITACGVAVDAKLLSRAMAVKIIASVAVYLGVEIDAEAELAAADAEAAKKAESDVFHNPLAGDPAPPAADPGAQP